MSLNDALKLAQKYNLDLVEINSNIYPPICKIFDYGKFIYAKKKKKKKLKKINKHLNTKEIKFRPNTNINDYNTKINKTINCLKKGNKIKIIINLRGREIIHKKIALNMLNKIKLKLNNLSNIILHSKNTESRQIIMILQPKKNYK